jgi:hypothetical protein
VPCCRSAGQLGRKTSSPLTNTEEHALGGAERFVAACNCSTLVRRGPTNLCLTHARRLLPMVGFLGLSGLCQCSLLFDVNGLLGAGDSGPDATYPSSRDANSADTTIDAVNDGAGEDLDVGDGRGGDDHPGTDVADVANMDGGDGDGGGKPDVTGLDGMMTDGVVADSHDANAPETDADATTDASDGADRDADAGIPQDGMAPIANGNYAIINVPGTALDDPNGGGPGTTPDQVIYSGPNQKWGVALVSGSRYEIIAASGAALTATGNSGSIGMIGALSSYTGTDNQLWKFVPAGSYYNLMNVGTGLALDDHYGDSGVVPYQWPLDSTNANQRWTITPK